MWLNCVRKHSIQWNILFKIWNIISLSLLDVFVPLQCDYRDRWGASEHGLLPSVWCHQWPADRQRAPRVLRHLERSAWEGSLWGQQHILYSTLFTMTYFIGVLYVNWTYNSTFKGLFFCFCSPLRHYVGYWSIQINKQALSFISLYQCTNEKEDGWHSWKLSPVH